MVEINGVIITSYKKVFFSIFEYIAVHNEIDRAPWIGNGGAKIKRDMSF